MSVDLFIVREDAQVEALGAWHSAEKTLELVADGFPFCRRGTHRVDGDLPWLFWDMQPSGFMGARFISAFPELRLPAQPRLWSADHVVRALSHRGEDLTGNVLVGAESRDRFLALEARVRADPDFEADAAQLVHALRAQAARAPSSSVGGDRPKLVLHRLENGARSDVILKYATALSTPTGRRWRNLLVMEQLALDVLQTHGIEAASSRAGLVGDDVFGLLVRRFDRTERGGRVGAASLAWLAASRGEADLQAPDVMRRLCDDGLVGATDVRTLERAHAFSHAIGNGDTHLGNYGLLFDADGNARLGPMYDVTPMNLAPRADDLPDAFLTPRTAPIPSDVASLVTDLVAQARSSTALDADFLELWLRHIGA